MCDGDSNESKSQPQTIASSDFLLKHNSGVDLSNRYEKLLQRQFDSLSNLENKAWKTIGAITSVIGILLTGISVLAKVGNQPSDIGLLELLSLLLGISCLFISILYCIFVLVSTQAKYGPSTSLGDKLTEGDIDREYADFVLKNYKSSIDRNWTCIETKSEYLRKSFSFLISGLLFSTISFLFVIFIPGSEMNHLKLFLLIVALSASVFAGGYIWNREFQDSVEGDDESGDADTT